MRKPAAYLFAVLIGAIIWFFFQHFRIEGTETLRVVPKTEEELNSASLSESKKPLITIPKFLSPSKNVASEPNDHAPVPLKDTELTDQSRTTIRIASYHLQGFGPTTTDPESIQLLARLCRSFDIVALQGISPNGAHVIGELADEVGDTYDSILAPPLAIQRDAEQFAYIFDTRTITADRGDGLYTLGDPDDLLLRDPLVGWFRARQAPIEEAFTFTLVNVFTDRRRVRQELDVLDNAMLEIRRDGRQEDDVIMLGCFHIGNEQLGELANLTGLVTAVPSTPTTLMSDAQTENILFQAPMTDEYVGRSGVMNLVREFNLSARQLRRLSEYLPIWAEFSIYEGGRQRRVASDSPKRF